jgi:hypothetical protein
MTVIQHRRGATTEWAASSYILEAGEIGLDTTLMKIKIGDGTTAWSGLDFIGGADGGLLPTGGTAGQILAKDSSTDYDASWIDNYAVQIKHEVKLGEAISKGQAVYVSSANGTNMIVSKASNATEATSSKTMGLLETGGSTNDFVKVITEGLLAGLNTSSATAGDPVWLGTSGNLLYGLANKPYAPAHLVFIGIVTRSHADQGEIFIRPQNGFEINELHDVLITTPADDNNLLAYDSASSLWKNQTASQAGLSEVGHTHTVSNITDISTNYAALSGASFTGTVNVTTPNNGSSVILKNTDGTGVRVIAGESVSGSLPGVIFSPYVTGTEKTSSQFYYADNGDQWVFEPTLKLGNGYLTSGSATGYIFNTIATTLNIGGAATTLNLGAATGNTTIGNNLIVTGNLTVQGDQIITNTSTVEVEDSMIYIGTGNSADSMDIGIVGHRTPSGGSYQHTGFVRDASDGVWKLFTGVTTEPSGSTLDFTAATYEPIKIGALDASTGTFSGALTYGGVTLTNAVTGTGKMVLDTAPTIAGTLTSSGGIAANGGITLAQKKNGLVASAYNSATIDPNKFANDSRVIMTAAASGSTAPGVRPDGTALVAGDVWISW